MRASLTPTDPAKESPRPSTKCIAARREARIDDEVRLDLRFASLGRLNQLANANPALQGRSFQLQVLLVMRSRNQLIVIKKKRGGKDEEEDCAEAMERLCD